MKYLEIKLYILKIEFNFLETMTSQTDYFIETYPQYRLNSVGVYETEFNEETFEVLVIFEYEE